METEDEAGIHAHETVVGALPHAGGGLFRPQMARKRGVNSLQHGRRDINNQGVAFSGGLIKNHTFSLPFNTFLVTLQAANNNMQRWMTIHCRE